MSIDYYIILGVPRGATIEQIKKAYRQQAKSLHPDVSDDALATAKFQLLNEAYNTLVNINKRRVYDYTLLHRREYYSRNPRSRRYSTSYNNYYRFYNQQKQSQSRNSKNKDEPVLKKNLLDNMLFYSLLFIGFIGIIFGIFDILYKEWMGISNLYGIFFSISFTAILIYGWRLLGKE